MVSLAGLFTGYGILKARQLNGYYLPTNIYVQFGDAYNHKIAYYSGILSSTSGTTVGYREYRDVGTKTILLAYCTKKKAWTFSDKGDSCDFFAKSPETLSYDVTTISNSDWQVRDAFKQLQPFDKFSLVARDCVSSCKSKNCTDDGFCVCARDQFGMDCEFTDICLELSTDLRFAAFPGTAGGEKKVEYYNTNFDDDGYRHYLWAHVGNEKHAVSNQYEALADPTTGGYVKVYNMPVSVLLGQPIGNASLHPDANMPFCE